MYFFIQWKEIYIDFDMILKFDRVGVCVRVRVRVRVCVCARVCV